MACLLVTAAEAAVVTVAARVIRSAEKDIPAVKLDPSKGAARSPFLRKLKWLSNMLWGGSFLLAFEHITSGEIVPWFPFLTATASPGETRVMLFEMGTSGVAMAVLVTAVWAGMVIVSNSLEKRPAPKEVPQ